MSGALYVLDLRGEKVTVRKVMDGGATGIGLALPRNRIYVAYPSGVRVFDARLREIRDEGFVLPGADVHDVTWDDETLVVVETSLNRVVAYAAPGRVSWSWVPSPGEGDRSHVNSIIKRDGVWITSMFSPEGLGEPWSSRVDGALVEIASDRRMGGTILRRGLRQPHSLAAFDGTLWLCESRSKRVLRLADSVDHDPEVIAELPAYTRGLCIDDEWMLVGQSRSDAHFVKPLLSPEPTKRDPGMCGVWFISRGEGRRFFVELPSLEVYDIVQLTC